MACSGSYSVNVCDSDHKNPGGSDFTEGSFRLFSESKGPGQRCSPETMELEVFRECAGSESTNSSQTLEELPIRRQSSSLQRDDWSAATVEILSSMPSRKALHTGFHSSVRVRTRQSHGIHQNSRAIQAAEEKENQTEASTDSVDNVLGSGFCVDEDNKDPLVSSLQGLSVSDGLRKLRGTPLCLADKKEIRCTI